MVRHAEVEETARWRPAASSRNRVGGVATIPLESSVLLACLLACLIACDRAPVRSEPQPAHASNPVPSAAADDDPQLVTHRAIDAGVGADADADAGADADRAATPRCAARDPLRNAYFGDLHVHTGLSADAFATDTRTTLDEAYAFARGQEVRLPPLDADGKGLRSARLERPLDFAAITDHAENFGEVAICTDPEDPAYRSPNCVAFRSPASTADSADSIIVRMAALMGVEPMVAARNVNVVRPAAVCGADGERCAAATRSVWKDVQAAAARWDDSSASCEFSTFIAYEWTLTPNFTKIHRNVIFRNTAVPEAPIHSIEETTAPGLWRRLREECLDAGTGCDVLAIPHNPNLSNGNLFAAEIPVDAPIAQQRALARERADLERLVEVMQVKGDSECRNGLSGIVGVPDEFCSFEEFRPPDAPDCADGQGSGALAGRGCVSRRDYVRNVLGIGLVEARRIGVNPFEFGIIASTDTHNGTPGDTEEYSFDGAGGFRDADPVSRLGSAKATIVVPDLLKNPGGLVGVWAEENSRESLFAAMKRRETFGTSGPRIRVRFFAGWDYPESICDGDSLVAQGYAGGVSMGGRMAPRPGQAGAPRFVVSAMRDPGIATHPGGLLQRIQIIKQWVGDDELVHQEVFDVAGGANAAEVDVRTCAPQGPGANALCALWTDPAFDPARRAVYYARVLENPSCRWTGWECLRLRRDEAGQSNATTLPAVCEYPDETHKIQERAWTSPIWYTPSEPAVVRAGGGALESPTPGERGEPDSGQNATPPFTQSVVPVM